MPLVNAVALAAYVISALKPPNADNVMMSYYMRLCERTKLSALARMACEIVSNGKHINRFLFLLRT